MPVGKRLVETPGRRRKRLKEERLETVKKMQEKAGKKLLEELTKDPIFDAIHLSNFGEKIIFCPHKEAAICVVRIAIRNNREKISLELRPIQGLAEGGGRQARFREEHGNNYYIFVTRSLIDAAYKAGFDEVKLKEVKETYDYQEIQAETEKEKGLIRQRMRSQQGQIVKECDFRKDKDGFVRKFP